MDRILVIGAHYDDSELGAGGTMSKLVSQGKEVYKITLTDTEVFSDIMNIDIKGENVKQNSARACAVLGVSEIEVTQSIYGHLLYSQSIMQEIEKIIIDYKIDTCIFHFADDYNTDHIAANQICKTASRHCKNTLMFQSNPYILPMAFTPNFFVDISEYVDLKRTALECYEKEHDRQGRLFETNIERNYIWGYGNHVVAAEGFKLIKYCI